nr:hypothetical protein [uncultured Roseococcus sp.]
MDPTDPAAFWWINAAQAPAMGALYWLLYGIRRDLDRRGGPDPQDGLSRTREDLAAFKLEVARTYVPLSLIRDVDRRLTEQLLRIESKLAEVHRRQDRGE